MPGPSAYVVFEVLKKIDAKLLLVHNEHDEDVPFSDTLCLQDARDDISFVATKGAGHQNILGNRTMMRAVERFLDNHDV